jgi:hypothetical protein
VKSRKLIDSKISNADTKAPKFIMTAPPFDAQNEECMHLI